MVYSNTPDSPRPLQKLRAQLSAATDRAEAQQSGHALLGALFLLAAYCRAGQAAILEVNGSTKTLLNASLAATGQAKEKQRIAGLLANPEVRAALQEKGSYVSNKHPLGNKPGVSATAKSGKTASLAVLKLQSTGTGYYCLLLFSEFPRLWTKKTLLALKHPAARLAEVAGAINRNSALQAKQGVMPAPGFCYFADGHGRFAGITESVSLSLGYEKAEFLNNRSLFESLLPRYYLPVWQGRLSIVSPNACDAAQLEVIVATKSGKPVRIGFFTVPVYKSGSSPAGYCSVAHVMSDGEHLEKSTKLAALPAEAAGLLADPPALEIWVNHDKTVSYISDSFEALTGYPAEKFIENPALFRDITHPDDLAPWDDYALSIAQDRKPKEIERRIICMNGEVRRLKTRITHVTDPAGNYRGFLSSTTVAERQLPPANKAAKEMPSISEVEQFYKAITDFTFDLEIYLLTGNKIVYVSPSSLRITGYSPEEAVSNPELLTALLHPADRAQAEQFREKVKSSRQPQITELRIRRRDGKLIWLEVAGVKVYNETGLLLGYRLSCREISRRKNLENELSIRSKEYSEIVESQLDLIVRYRTEGTILFANKPFAAFYGTTPEKLEGSSIHSLIPTERKDDFLGMLSKLSERKPVIKRVYSYPQANGNVTFIEWSDKCSFDSEGNPVEVQAVGRDVTGLIRIQEQLQQSEARYRAVLESQTDMIVRFSADSTLQYINAAFARWMGVDAGMLIGRQWLGMLENPAIWQMVAKQMESMTTDDPSRELELSRLRGDDDDRWYSWIGTGIFDSAGQLIELQVVGRDITRQKKAEAALLSAYEKIKELEQLYRITADFTPDMDRWVLPGGKLAYISPACEKLTGYTRREFMDNPALLDHIIHPLDTERYIAARHAYQDGEEITSAEYRIITKAGTEKWIEITANRVYDDEGNAMGTRTSSRDISLRKQLEENLRISRDQYSKFVEAQLDLICRYLPDGTLQFVNQAYAQFFGSQPEFLAGTSIFSLVPAHRLSDFHNIISQLSAGAPFSRDEQDYTDAGGNTVWKEWINFGSFDTYGVLQEIQGVGRDITYLKETEMKLVAALEEVEGLTIKLEEENRYLRTNYEPAAITGSMFSSSPLMVEVLDKARQVAFTDTPVLLTGETGTGKEVLAHDIHKASKRSHKLMITVNCAALPPSLIESELFGREKGAYTGAMAKQIGLFELADGSTIFLDEIGELPLEMQVKLLRIIQSGEFQMLGSPVTKKTDVRIIAATNRDLSKAIAEGRFRSDLFYRLNVFPINLPPLRERKEDIAVLAWNFVDELSQTMGKQIDRISPKGMKKLMDYDWPGNIRELRNILEYSIILCNSPKLDIQLHATGPEELKFDNLDLELKRHIEKVLIQTGWKVRGEGGAAERLGMKESTLRFRMKKLGISKKS